MATLPPPPINDDQAGFGWIDWQRQVRDSIKGTEGQVAWTDIDFTGSNINDIQAKNHNILQGLQGGKSQEYYHLTQAQYNALGTGDHNSLNNLQGGITTERYHLTEPQYNWVVAGGTPYTLPIASATLLGGIKVGANLTIDPVTGVLDAAGGGGGGGITGPFPSILNSVALWDNTLGTLLKSGPTIDTLAPLASPTFSGAPTAPTATLGSNNTQLATTAFVQAANTGLVAQTITNGVTTSAPSQDAVFDALALKANLASPVFTGSPAAPTRSFGNNTTSLATTEFVQSAVSAVGSGPSGMVSDFAFATPPSGWLLCDGAAVSRTTYSALFAAVGTTWGAGDGSTTFNLPSIAYYTQDLYKTGSGGTGTATTITCIKT